MNKEQFLDELEKLLQDIDSIERDEALNYYRDYFEDAGSEHEQEVIDELGTPEKVAQTIKEGLDINEQENEEVIHHYNERNNQRGDIFDAAMAKGMLPVGPAAGQPRPDHGHQ